MVERPPLSEKFHRALVYAARLHSRQFRKGTTRPYVGHLLGVASLVLQSGGTEEEAIAALLHDAVEDQGGQKTLLEIRKRFGPRVAKIVEGCSDSDTIPKPPWRERKEKYITEVASAPASVRLVSAADKLYNAREVLADYRLHRDAVWSRFSGGKHGTLWYYREMEKALRATGGTPLVDELDRVVTELERLAMH
ncbi:MAG: HD domain-containing protein [Candidatus Acidiferrales bacterium]